MIGSFRTWQDLRNSTEKTDVEERFKNNLNMQTVQSLSDLYFLIDFHIEEQIHAGFNSDTKDIKESRAYVRGLNWVKRLLEPVVNPK